MHPAKKLAIVGCGKMGRLIEQLAPQHNFQVALLLDERDNANGAGIDAKAFQGIDVAVEFTTPEAAPLNLKRLAAARIPTVTGTTGWLDHLPEVRQAVMQAGSGLVWSPNFSIGVNAFLRLVAEAGRLLAAQGEYGAWAWEIHHTAKKDAPSGTLLKLVEEMKKAGYGRVIDVSSNRAGMVPGTHEVGFDSSADTITLRHVARSREGFARGALRAAQWIVGRKGFYEFSDIIFSEPRP